MTDHVNIVNSHLNQPPAKRPRGRPPGSKGRPKAVVSREELYKFAQTVGPFIPKSQMEYLSAVLEGKTPSELEKDVDIFLSLQLKALLPNLATEIKEGTLTKEATARSSVVKEILALRFQMRRYEQGEDKPNYITFIQQNFSDRGIDPERLARLVGGRVDLPAGDVPRLVSGNSDDDEGQADEAGSLSD